MSLFGTRTEYQRQLENVKNFFEKEVKGFQAIKEVFNTRSNLEAEYSRNIRILVGELQKKTDKMYNKTFKSSMEYICEDWLSLAAKRRKLGAEFQEMGGRDMDRFIEHYKSIIRKWFIDLKRMETSAVGSYEVYKEIEELFLTSQNKMKKAFKNKSKDKTLITELKLEKEKAENRLLRLGRKILLDKERFGITIEKVGKSIRVRQGSIGKFSRDVALKNFILQISKLKDREYDLNQIITNFNNGQNLDALHSISKDIDLSSSMISVSSNTSENWDFKKEPNILPFHLDIPEKRFLINLERNFYKGIHNKLLTTEHLINNDFTQKISFSEFEVKSLLLSKLLDRIKLNEEEIHILKKLSVQEHNEKFIERFLESFNRYKKRDIIITESIAQFFLNEIVVPILKNLYVKQNFQFIFEFLFQLQFIKVVDEEVKVFRDNKSAIGIPHKTIEKTKNTKRRKKSSINLTFENYVSFREWLDRFPNNPIMFVLTLKNVWKTAFNNLFGKYNLPDADSEKIEEPKEPLNENNNFQSKAISLLQRFKNTTKLFINRNHQEQDEMNSVESNKIKEESTLLMEDDQEIIRKMILANLLSCRQYSLKNPDFSEIIETLQKRVDKFDVKEEWKSLIHSSSMDHWIRDLKYFCFSKDEVGHFKEKIL